MTFMFFGTFQTASTGALTTRSVTEDFGFFLEWGATGG